MSPTRTVIGSGTNQPDLSAGSSGDAATNLPQTTAVVLIVLAALIGVIVVVKKRARSRTAGRMSLTETINMTSIMGAIEAEPIASPSDMVESRSAGGGGGAAAIASGFRAASPLSSPSSGSSTRWGDTGYISVRGLGGESSTDDEAELLGALPGVSAVPSSRGSFPTSPADLAKITMRRVGDGSPDAYPEPHTVKHASDRKLRAGIITKEEHEHIMKMHVMIGALDDDDAGALPASAASPSTSPPVATMSWL